MAGRVKESDARQLAALIEDLEAKGYNLHFVRLTNTGGRYSDSSRGLETYFYLKIGPWVRDVPLTLEGRDIEALHDQVSRFPAVPNKEG